MYIDYTLITLIGKAIEDSRESWEKKKIDKSKAWFGFKKIHVTF